MKKIILSILVIFLFLNSDLAVFAIGLSVFPKKLEIESKVNKTVTEKIMVKNPSAEVSVFKVYPDDFDNFIKIVPPSFILEFQDSKEVTVEITPKEEGILKTSISIEAFPVASGTFDAGGGIKIPLTITVNNSQNFWLAKLPNWPFRTDEIVWIILLILIISGVLFAIRQKPLKTKK